MTVDEQTAVRPTLAFVYSGLETEDPPLLLAEAAQGVATLVWVVPDMGRLPRAVTRMLRGLGEIVDASGLAGDAAADALRAHRLAGIVCCNDLHLLWAAQIARALELDFFSPQTAIRLTDKLSQRRALRDGGLATPDFWDVDDLLAPAAAERFSQSAVFPLVLKPRHGHASQDVEAIRSVGQLRSALQDAEPGRMLLEGFIPDPRDLPEGSATAPYVSVELMVAGGRVGVLGVTGRPPLAPPFRETGVVFPADLPAQAREDAVEVASAAARALGVSRGPLHVEVKFTDDGPVVIEVNGVMGGGAIRDIMQRTVGIDILRLTMRVAAGAPADVEIPSAPNGVGFFFELHPDERARRILSVTGLESAAEIPGVERVIPGLRAGDDCSWRTGTHAYVAAILGVSDDHAAAHRARREFLDRVQVAVDY